MKSRLLLGTLLLAFLATACGGSGGKTVETKAGSVAGSEQSTTTTTAAPTTTTTAKKPAITAEALQSALLTVADVPSGYAVSPPNEDSDDSDDAYCDGLDPSKTVPPAVEKDASFQKGSFGPFLSEGLLLFPSEGEAKRYMTEFRKILDSCSSYEQTDKDGTKSTVTLGKMPFDKVGDDTLAVRFTVQGAFPVSGDVVAIRRGPVVIGIGNLGFGSADFNDTAKVVSKADEKVRRVL